MKKLYIIIIVITALFSLSSCALLSNILGLDTYTADNTATDSNNVVETAEPIDNVVETAGPIDRLVKAGSYVFAIDKSDSLYLLSKLSKDSHNDFSLSKKVISEPVKNVSIREYYKNADGATDNIINIKMKDGSLYEWYVGNDTMPKKINISEPIEGSLQSSYGISYFDTLSGALYAYGYNIDGSLGVGNYDEKIISPTKINIPEPVIDYSLLIKDKSGWYSYSTYAGKFSYSTYAVTDNGSLYVWGYNENGELLLGDTKNRISPVKVDFPEPIKYIEPVTSRAIIITNNGSLWTASDFTSPLKKMNIKGKVKKIKFDTKIINYEVCETYFALTEDGSLYSWGNNIGGQLGLGNDKGRYSDKPLKINIPEPVKEIIIDEGSYYVITKNGSLYSWGGNQSGMLMNDMDEPIIYTPKKVNISGKVKKLKNVNYNYTYIITEDGSLYSWSDNEYGQLGIGNFKEGYFNKPVKVKINEPVKEIITNEDASSIYAVTKNGSLYSWGSNRSGELGINSYEDTNIPTKVDIPEPVKQIEIKGAEEGNKYKIYCYVVTDNGSLYFWGDGKIIKPLKIEY